MEVLSGGLDYIMLLFLRSSALVFSSPFFGRRNIPAMAKIGFSAALAYLFYIAVPQGAPLVYENTGVFVLLCIKELLLGLIFGFVTTLFVSVTFTAGQIIDMQMGFGMVNVFDVQSNVSIPIVGNLYNVVLLLCFFALNGHLKLIYILYATVLRVPVGSVAVTPDIFLYSAELFSLCFVLAVQVALPIVFSGLLGEAAMAVVIRTVPQLNVFSVGLPLKVVLGFVVLIFVIPIYIGFTSTIFDKMYIGLDHMFAGMMP